MSILDIIPDDLKRELLDGVVGFLVGQAKKMGNDQIANSIGHLSSQATFQKAFDTSMEHAITRFRTEYQVQDEELMIAITTDGDFWKSKAVRQRLIALIKRPGAWLAEEKGAVVQHFIDVLPSHVNRERVDAAVNFLLRCVVEELWTLPGAREIREVYSLQFQKIGTEAAQRQVALMEAQLQSTTQLSIDMRQALLQLTTMLEQRVLSAPILQLPVPPARPYHNLPQPDYTRFVGRKKELDRLRQHLLPDDRAWQIVLTGIGGVGKSTLALAIAHEYYEHYQELEPEERFEAIIWISAKEEVLTIKGREKLALSGLTFYTLEDIYTTIAQALEREDITRALVAETQTHLVQKALSAQRTLLIVDNLEGVIDKRVGAFLYHLPMPTKCIITSREWVDAAVMLKLTGLPFEEAEKMLVAETETRGVYLNTSQRLGRTSLPVGSLRTRSRSAGTSSAPANGSGLRSRWVLICSGGLLGGAHWIAQSLRNGVAQTASKVPCVVVVDAARTVASQSASRTDCCHQSPDPPRPSHRYHPSQRAWGNRR